MFDDYISNIIYIEQRKLIKLLIDKFGESDDFTYDILCEKFIKMQKIVLVDDNFGTLKKRGRPRKVS